MSLTDKGYIYAGNTYSDTLPTGVDDGYDAVLYAGVTYSVVLDSASTPLVYGVAGPQGIVADGTIYSGQEFTYTPTVSPLCLGSWYRTRGTRRLHFHGR